MRLVCFPAKHSSMICFCEYPSQHSVPVTQRTRTLGPSVEMEQGLVSYINPSVLHNTMVNMADRLGETRPATVLFISCRYVTPTNGIRTLQKYTLVCQDVAQQVCCMSAMARGMLSCVHLNVVL